jgi:hypothetical protein
MKIVNNKTVVLTDNEARLQERFEELLSSGLGIASAANRIREQNRGIDPAFYRWLMDEPLLQEQAKPNLIERMENLIAALDDARTVAGDIVSDPVDMSRIEAEIGNAEGIAGEVLTMIDGR